MANHTSSTLPHSFPDLDVHPFSRLTKQIDTDICFIYLSVDVRAPSSFNLPYRDVEIQTSDKVTLKCFLVQYKRPRGTVVMFHGNGMDHSDLLYHARHYYWFRLNVLTVSYRGYGESGGIPSEKGLQRDAQAALEYLLHDPLLSQLPIIIYGLSLGGAVAIDVTSRNPDKIAALILENTFTSIPDIVRGWPIIGPFSFACTQRWNSASKLAKIPPNLPILFCSGRRDTVVPPSHMDRLWSIAQDRGRRQGSTEVERERGADVWVPPDRDSFERYANGGHVDTCVCPGYWSGVEQFITKCLSLRT
ncbi:alpha/beta-hydrolase [Macrolepiota fuliginosa MF-IS2]|uniref:Alpha/beta-hydrolase n=1 Tax=Macrolepiota fuliginosa MF-IS2 TaxID=1400762 RepID=A0A9P6BYZ3_9AGAR|nr:alpha/beta-hydrolase [Macrolepiota fuliginosa MF-IS2]